MLRISKVIIDGVQKRLIEGWMGGWAKQNFKDCLHQSRIKLECKKRIKNYLENKGKNIYLKLLPNTTQNF